MFSDLFRYSFGFPFARKCWGCIHKKTPIVLIKNMTECCCCCLRKRRRLQRAFFFMHSACILPGRRLVHVQVNTGICVLSSCVEIRNTFFCANNDVCINETWNGELTKEKKRSGRSVGSAPPKIKHNKIQFYEK